MAIALGLGCGGTATRTAPVAALDEVYTLFSRAYADLDADLAASLYTEDALYMSPSSEIRKGRAAIREGFARMFEGAKTNSEQLSIEFERIDRRISGDLAFEVGIYTLTRHATGKPDRTSRGKFAVVLYRERDGHWRFHVDSYSALDAEPTPLQLAAGDEYLSRLADGLRTGFSPPSNSHTAATGCVRLQSNGTVKESWVWPRSDDPGFDAAVSKSIAAFEPIGPVPDHLVESLTRGGACLQFRVSE